MQWEHGKLRKKVKIDLAKTSMTQAMRLRVQEKQGRLGQTVSRVGERQTVGKHSRSRADRGRQSAEWERDKLLVSTAGAGQTEADSQQSGRETNCW